MEVDTVQKLGVAYYLAQVGLSLGFLTWMFLRLEDIIAENGSLTYISTW